MMKLSILAALAACALTCAHAPAQAAEPVTARLARPAPERTQVIAGGAMFVCEADACVARSPTSQTFARTACQKIAAQVGPVTAFTAGRDQLDAARLAQCNQGAAPAAGAAPARQ